MYVLRGRQSNKKGGQAISASVLAALLSALLFLSPGTARAVAHVLVENGVALPANMVRVLDALPAEPNRDVLRREDENATNVTQDHAVPSDEPKPADYAVVVAAQTAAPTLSYTPICQVVYTADVVVRTLRLPPCRSPRAPPV